MAKRIVLAGDSFGCEWPNGEGWPLMLAQQHGVNNIAQAGVGEYKILKQLWNLSARDAYWVNNYDCVIVCHTSPSRIHTTEHPVHKEGLHKDCDLIYTDIMDKFDWFNPRLRTAKNWFHHHYDDEYAIDIYNMIRNEIKKFIPIPYLAIDHFEISNFYAKEDNILNLTNTWPKYKGKVNHYSEEGNQIVYNQIIDKLDKIC